MKINGIQAQNVYESYQKNTQQNPVAKSDESQKDRGDTLELSAGASGLKDAGKLAKKAQDSLENKRASQIADIKSRIDAGTYQVSSTDVAKSILKGLIFDRFA